MVKKKSEWISVEDRMPKVSEPNGGQSDDVLVSDGKYISIGYFEAEYNIEDDSNPYESQKEMFSSADWYTYNSYIDEVLFWMPLPELPK